MTFVEAVLALRGTTDGLSTSSAGARPSSWGGSGMVVVLGARRLGDTSCYQVVMSSDAVGRGFVRYCPTQNDIIDPTWAVVELGEVQGEVIDNG